MPAAPDLHLRNSTEIQGDILAAFNKDHRVYLFLRFPDQARGRAWLKEIVPLISTTKAVADFNVSFHDARVANGGVDPDLKATWVNVSFTLGGLKLLLKSDPSRDLAQFQAFVDGPLTRTGINGDTQLSDPKNWVVGGHNQIIHALLNIQSDGPDALSGQVQKLKAIGAKHGISIVFEQSGATLPDPLKGHEHFGFKDGISQPGVAGFDTPDAKDTGHVQGHPGTEIIAAGEFILGETDESGQKFSAAHLDWMKNGSFQVFRRLNQDVAGFEEHENANLHSLPPGDPLRNMLGAKLVGRWKSGTPIDLSPDKDSQLTDKSHDNNFKFLNDEPGDRCPRFAHIRKVYPRQDNAFGDRMRRILRRGVPFGAPFHPTGGVGQDAKSERGLLFVAYMSSIESQFEFLQGTWVNNSTFPVGGAGPDPVIGGGQSGTVRNTLRHQGKDLDMDFKGFVHTTGTLYAFAPSITTLKGLANGTL